MFMIYMKKLLIKLFCKRNIHFGIWQKKRNTNKLIAGTKIVQYIGEEREEKKVPGYVIRYRRCTLCGELIITSIARIITKNNIKEYVKNNVFKVSDELIDADLRYNNKKPYDKVLIEKGTLFLNYHTLQPESISFGSITMNKKKGAKNGTKTR